MLHNMMKKMGEVIFGLSEVTYRHSRRKKIPVVPKGHGLPNSSWLVRMFDQWAIPDS